MSKQEYVTHGELQIAAPLHQLLEKEVAPGTGVSPDQFWTSLEEIIRDFSPRIKEHLETRDNIQSQIDEWHKGNKKLDAAKYKSFLQKIGYLESEPADFSVTTENVDPEIASIAGPQLVVPLDNARFVLNAANARWGSLYDALYGSDVIAEADGCEQGSSYNPLRGERVIKYTRDFLDRHFVLEYGSHEYITRYFVKDGQFMARAGCGANIPLLYPERFVGFTGDTAQPDSIVLRKNNLHVILKFGEDYSIGRRDHANLYDVIVESAITTIMDCEDSVASVDTDDKVMVYRNWLGLMNGSLQHKFKKGGEEIDRVLNADVEFTAPDGSDSSLPGRSTLLVRNVGSQLDIDCVLYNNHPVPETLIDAMFTSLCAKHDLLGKGDFRNTRAGSVYIVKPKMHGSTEVALAVELFDRVEKALGLEPKALKMGIMDEERRTTVNLKACINAASDRVVFINTGFLDRTGDDIHTSMEAGAMLPKAEIKQAVWLMAYEDNNVDTGLACGLKGRAQIGKGMWAMPDEMHDMVKTKIQHLKQGCNTAWVPSPTAATLHALHYFLMDVDHRQNLLATRTPASVDDILKIPLLPSDRKLTEVEIQRELDNNAQSILGYVARWVGQGIGCSKVLDINNVALMEDCATLRISSQHIANWLHHGILSEEQVTDSMKRLAAYVDEQNADDESYLPMASDFDNSVTFQASLDLAIKGRVQPNGYTEFILYEKRLEAKA